MSPCHQLNAKVQRSELAANRLLSALPDTTQQRWLPHLEWCELPVGFVLSEPHAQRSHVYFPTTAIVSLVYLLTNGESVEVAMLGREGVAGLGLFMGRGATPSRATVQSAGRSLRLSSQVLREEFSEGGPAQPVLLRYTAALFVQVCQTAVCNQHHSLDQRLCRWLLLSLDRLPDNQLVVTQELIAGLLGVRRAGVNASATNLQDEGIVRYARGRIAALDRAALERRACECYGVMRDEYRQLLPLDRDLGADRTPLREALAGVL